MEAPKRSFEMVIEIGADTLQDVANTLRSIEFDVYESIEKGFSGKHVSTSGSSSSGYNFSLIRTETNSHDEYFEKLEAWLEERRKEKAEGKGEKG